MDWQFWEAADILVARHEVVIDRPQRASGVDYGYLAGTRAADGEGVDVWVGSLPDRRVTGAIMTVDARRAGLDAEVKLLLGCTLDEARRAQAAHNAVGLAEAVRDDLRRRGEWAGALLVMRD